MNLRYYTSGGTAIDLTTVIGRGGEGSVYALADDRLVAKVYSSPIDSSKAQKLKWMAETCSDQLLTTAAWVLDTLHEKSSTGTIVGFVMPRIVAKEVHELYSPKSRRLYFPKADWRFLILTAKNLAAAFNNMHAAGHVIGDVNQGNVVVLPNANVKLIDCDSYQLNINGRIFPCEVGVSTHVPPELQGVPLDRVVRTQNNDNFGLAVLIFQILFLGRHPYAGNFIGAQDKTLDDSIREHRFAYGEDAHTRQVKQPPGTLKLESLNTPTVDLFRRAFLRDIERPVAFDWYNALNELHAGLVQCKTQVSHHYHKTQANCPWCEVEKTNPWPVFPVLTASGSTKGFDLPTLEGLLRSVRSAGIHGDLPTRSKTMPPPSVDLAATKSQIRRGLILILVLQSIGLMVAVLTAGPGRAFLGSLLVVGFAIAWASRLNRSAHKKEYDEFKAIQLQWTAVEQSWRSLGQKHAELKKGCETIEEQIKQYKQLDNLRSKKLKQLEVDAHKHQLQSYLDGFDIAQASISGIGWKKLQVLQSFGINSAADIEQRKIMQIPGFGPANTSKLIAWRRAIEARFVFNLRTGVPKQEVQRVEHECANLRLRAETSLTTISQKLRSDRSFYIQSQKRLSEQAKVLRNKLDQSQSNVGATTLVTLPMAALVALSFGIPFASLIQRLATRELVEVPTTVYVAPPPAATSTAIAAVNVNAVNANVAANTNSNVGTISDAEILLMSDNEKHAKVKELYDKGVLLTRSNKYAGAEKAYVEALRYSPDNVSLLHELGYARLKLKKYSAAIEVLQQAIKLDRDNKDPELRKILGNTYIAAEKWPEAVSIYKTLSYQSPNVFEYQLQLGISAKKAGDITTAIAALEKASGIKWTDAKAHYELANLYIDQGRFADARSEADILQRLDTKLANDILSRLNN